MKIFLSWSGIQSKEIAKSYKTALQTVVQCAEIFMSEDDIRAGSVWLDTIYSKLQGTSFGIIFLTPENLTSSWVAFEAGAILKGFTENRLVCCLYGIDHSELLSTPYSTVQNIEANKKGFQNLIQSIASVSSDFSRVSIDIRNKLTEFAWLELDGAIAKIPTSISKGKKAKSEDTNNQDFARLEQLIHQIYIFSSKNYQENAARSFMLPFRKELSMLRDTLGPEQTIALIDYALLENMRRISDEEFPGLKNKEETLDLLRRFLYKVREQVQDAVLKNIA